MAVTLLLPTRSSDNRRAGRPELCYLHQLSSRGWIPVLIPEIQQWCEDQGLTYDCRVKSYQWGEFKFHDANLAMLFKLTWL